MSRETLSKDSLPLVLPQPCPICGAKVNLNDVDEWESETGKVLHCDYDCETEPDIDDEGDAWEDWFATHWHMPYVYWLPWETKMLEWLNTHYRYFP